jgi:apolipoprotein N-acyltransferase
MTPIAAWFDAARGWRRAALGVTAGALCALAHAPVFAWPVMFITLPALMLLLDGAIAQRAGDRRFSGFARAAWIGWLFGFGYFLAGLYWIAEPFFVEPDKFLWAMPFAVTGVPAALALFYAAACALAALVWRPGGWRIASLAAAFFALEWARGHVLTGFPWISIGYTLTSSDALMQAASITGVYGLGFFAVLIFAAPAALLRDARLFSARLTAAAAFATLAIAAAWGAARLASHPTEFTAGVKLRIVQGNIPQAEKWRPENRNWIFARYLRLSSENASQGLTHVIWPESATPFLFMADDEIFDPNAPDALKSVIPANGSLILGAERATTTRDSENRRVLKGVYNTLFVLESEARIVARYDKNHLVPFGEYLPFPSFFQWLGFKHLTHHAIGFEKGETRPALSSRGAPAFSPLICYEIIFPGQVEPDGEAGWMLNITNDAWFGSTSGPYQHLHQARVRAVEEGKPVVRAANTGVSAIIDAYGRTLSALPLNREGVIDGALPNANGGTVYVKIRQTGFLPFILLIVVVYFAPIVVVRTVKR